MTLPELLSDPIRARIYIEVFLNKEITAKELMTKVKISRSTLSHHLSKFVEEDVLKVRVGSKKHYRLVKYYSINPNFSERMIIETKQDINELKRKAFLESSAAHLQVISNLILEYNEEPKKRGSNVTFTFKFLTEEDANIWLEEYENFQIRLDKRLDKIRKSPEKEKSFTYITFGGMVPT